MPNLTLHAQQRAAQRSIPHPIVGLILDYGDSRAARDGARKFAISKAGLREIRRDLGREAARQIDRYRKAYVVADADVVITAAFGDRPLFH